MNSTKCPRIIWIYWYQGLGQALHVVQECARTWEALNPEYAVHRLSADNLAEFLDLTQIIPPGRMKKMNVVALSDIIRFYLLERHGGVWVDSTLFRRKSLSDWFPDQGEFYAFRNPGPDRLISVWFLAAIPDTYIINNWCTQARNYWTSWKLKRVYFLAAFAL